jgi:hypothetical protein
VCCRRWQTVYLYVCHQVYWCGVMSCCRCKNMSERGGDHHEV